MINLLVKKTLWYYLRFQIIGDNKWCSFLPGPSMSALPASLVSPLTTTPGWPLCLDGGCSVRPRGRERPSWGRCRCHSCQIKVKGLSFLFLSLRCFIVNVLSLLREKKIELIDFLFNEQIFTIGILLFNFEWSVKRLVSFIGTALHVSHKIWLCRTFPEVFSVKIYSFFQSATPSTALPQSPMECFARGEGEKTLVRWGISFLDLFMALKPLWTINIRTSLQKSEYPSFVLRLQVQKHSKIS